MFTLNIYTNLSIYPKLPYRYMTKSANYLWAQWRYIPLSMLIAKIRIIFVRYTCELLMALLCSAVPEGLDEQCRSSKSSLIIWRYVCYVYDHTRHSKGLVELNWAATLENLSSGVCEQQRRRPACAFAQSDQRLYYLLLGKYYI